jgi:hypothetical protein
MSRYSYTPDSSNPSDPPNPAFSNRSDSGISHGIHDRQRYQDSSFRHGNLMAIQNLLVPTAGVQPPTHLPAHAYDPYPRMGGNPMAIQNFLLAPAAAGQPPARLPEAHSATHYLSSNANTLPASIAPDKRLDDEPVFVCHQYAIFKSRPGVHPPEIIFRQSDSKLARQDTYVSPLLVSPRGTDRDISLAYKVGLRVYNNIWLSMLFYRFGNWVLSGFRTTVLFRPSVRITRNAPPMNTGENGNSNV